MEVTLLQYMAALAAALAAGLGKTGLVGASILMVPLMVSAFPPGRQAGIMLPVLLAADILAVAWYRRAGRVRLVLRTLPWAVAGIAVGFLILRLFIAEDAPYHSPDSDLWLRRALGAGILAMIGIGLRVGGLVGSCAPQDPVGDTAPVSGASVPKTGEETPLAISGAWLAPLVGAAAGLASIVANASGPIWIIYLIMLRLPKREFIGTSAWAFLIIDCVKLPLQISLGHIGPDTLLLNAWMLPGLAAGCALGIWVLPRVEQKRFNRAAAALAALGGVYLLLG